MKPEPKDPVPPRTEEKGVEAKKNPAPRFMIRRTMGASPLDRLSDLIEDEGGTTGTRCQNRSATSTFP